MSNLVKTPLTKFGKVVKKRLGELRKTQRWLAKELNITPAYLGDVMRGRGTEEHIKDRTFEILGIK